MDSNGEQIISSRGRGTSGGGVKVGLQGSRSRHSILTLEALVYHAGALA